MLDCTSLPKNYSLRLILIRHGEPDESVKGKCYGRLNVGLSEAGRMQIQTKLNSIPDLSAQALYASPLLRAVETAAIVGARLGLETTISPELQEISFGRLENLSYRQIEELYPQEYKLWMERPTEIQFPDGESFSQMKERVLEFERSLLRSNEGQAVVLVSHGGVNRIILAHALGIADERIFRMDQAYAAVNIIDYLGESSIVRLMNG